MEKGRIERVEEGGRKKGEGGRGTEEGEGWRRERDGGERDGEGKGREGKGREGKEGGRKGGKEGGRCVEKKTSKGRGGGKEHSYSQRSQDFGNQSSGGS